jgi:hypothetical protein
MARSHSARRRLGTPGRAALLLGLGALAPIGAQAGQAASGDLALRSEGGRIYLSEAGGGFRDLALGDTAEARRLRQLIEERAAPNGAVRLRPGPTTLAGGGGAGFHWWSPAEKTDKAAAPGKPGKAGKAAPPPKTDAAEAGKKG